MNLMKCTACGLCSKRNNVVRSNDVFLAGQEMLIAGYPGILEDLAGRPFKTAFDLNHLEHWLQYIGTSSNKIRITYAVKCRPVANDGTTILPDKEHIMTCRKWLIKEVCYFQPKVIFLLGQVALDGLFNFGFMIDDEAGQLFWENKYKCFVVVGYEPVELKQRSFDKVAVQKQKRFLLLAKALKKSALKEYWTRSEFNTIYAGAIIDRLQKKFNVNVKYFPNLPF